MKLRHCFRAAPPLTALVLALLTWGGRRASAQTVATVTVAANVSNTLIAVARLNDLAFGTVVGGTPTTIAPRTSANAGKFEFHGPKKAQFNATFTLPTVLQAGAGGPTMPITFSATSGCHNTVNTQAACTLYDPKTALIDRIHNGAPTLDYYYIWIGGTVSPAVGQQAGVYQGTITLSAFFTGL